MQFIVCVALSPVILTVFIQASAGDNIAAYKILERIFSTATTVGEAFKDKAIATDTELTFHTKELLR